MKLYKILNCLFAAIIICFLPTQAQNKTEKKVTETNAIEEIISKVEKNQNIENFDNFFPLSAAKNVPKNAIYADITKSASERAMDLIQRLTFNEKLKLTGGFSTMYFPGLEQLGLRPVSMADASQGIHLRENSIKGKSTSFPGMLSLASTWNTDLAEKFGNAIGEECRLLGADVMLGPGINMQRFSVSGRNFEYMGEDPLVTSKISVGYVKGIQKNKVIATAKHFIGNDQEFCRHIANCTIDERTLREIYLPPWEAVVKEGNIKALMTGNNMTNGAPCCMNRPLEADLVRREYGFTGIIMSDWSNTMYYDDKTALALTSGHSLYMSSNQSVSKYIKSEIAKSPERKAEIEIMLEKMVYANLFPFFEMGIYDRHPVDKAFANKYDEHKSLARQVASESVCLLKNEKGILPVSKTKNILMMGSAEVHSGTGSGFVAGFDHVSYADGMKKMYGDKFTYTEKPADKIIRQSDVVVFLLNKAAGEGYDSPFDEPKAPIADLMRITKLNKNIIVIITSANPMTMPWLKNVKGLMWASMLGQERGDAIAGIISGEVNPSGKLPFTIEKDFADSQKPDFNYFGTTPYWFGHHPQYRDYWMGTKDKTDNIFHLYNKPREYVQIPFTEGVFMGYRWYEKKQIPVNFPFGFGLSYTTYEYSGLTIDNQLATNGVIAVSFDVKNIGKMAGSEVAQIYVSDKECSVERPVKELKAFQKVQLNVGETKHVTLELTKKDLAFWDIITHNWKVETGDFEISVGASSKDVKLKDTINF
jgi:beta-glucosidase